MGGFTMGGGAQAGSSAAPGALFTFDAGAWRREPVAAFDNFLSQRRVNGARVAQKLLRHLPGHVPAPA